MLSESSLTLFFREAQAALPVTDIPRYIHENGDAIPFSVSCRCSPPPGLGSPNGKPSSPAEFNTPAAPAPRFEAIPATCHRRSGHPIDLDRGWRHQRDHSARCRQRSRVRFSSRNTGETTTYTLTAVVPSGTVSATATVTVECGAPRREATARRQKLTLSRPPRRPIVPRVHRHRARQFDPTKLGGAARFYRNPAGRHGR